MDKIKDQKLKSKITNKKGKLSANFAEDTYYF